MHILWTMVKVVVGLALAIPLAIVGVALGLGVLGALLGLAILALKLAVLALVCWGLFRVASRLFRGPSRAPAQPVFDMPRPVDPHYEAAMRELEMELGGPPRP